MNKNITWNEHRVLDFDRLKKIKNPPITLWLTGLSGSGKSTIAQKFSELFYESNINEFVLDGDNIRHGLCSNLGFSPSDRQENVRRISETAKILNEAGVSVICPVISPYAKDRSMARNIIGDHKFIEVYCDCGLKTCEERDVKGLYKMARQGKISNFTGISAPYEIPVSPDIHVDTENLSVHESALIISKYLNKFRNIETQNSHYKYLDKT